jgi:hypothetical protein
MRYKIFTLLVSLVALTVVIPSVALSSSTSGPSKHKAPPPPPKTITLVCKKVSSKHGKVTLVCKRKGHKVTLVCKKDGKKLFRCKVFGHKKVTLLCQAPKKDGLHSDSGNHNTEYNIPVPRKHGKKVILVCTVQKKHHHAKNH